MKIFDRDYNNILKSEQSTLYAEYAYDYYKFYTDSIENDHENDDLQLIYGGKAAPEAEEEVASGEDSQDSNRADHPQNDYPDSDEGMSEDEDGNFERIAQQKYQENQSSLVDKFVRKKANYAGNYDFVQRSAESEERKYVDEVYEEEDSDST